MPYPGSLGQRPLNVQEAYEALQQYAADYGREPLLLLMHASVPETLRPDLLNLIRLNFRPGLQADHSLEADVLFCPLTVAMGAGYYRIDPQVRWHGLALLRSYYRDDPRPRARRVAELLWRYVEAMTVRARGAADPMLSEFINIQRWVALAFLEPAGASEAFADALRQGGADHSATVALRFGGLTSAIELPLAHQQDLLAYARGLDALVSGDEQRARELLETLGDSEIRVGDIALTSPAELLRQRLGAPTFSAGQKKADDKAGSNTQAASSPIGYQVFISYAHLDNRPAASEKGWVDEFHAVLQVMLSERLGRQARIWRDTRLTGNDSFDSPNMEALLRSAVVVAVISSAYLHSDWCMRDIAEFCSIADKEDRLVVDNRLTVFKVLKLPVENQDMLDPRLQSVLGYEFFSRDEDGRSREFALSLGGESKKYFYLRISDLADDIAKILQLLNAPDRGREGHQTRLGPIRIFLASCGADLRAESDRMRRELEAHGYQVVPAAKLPMEEQEHDREVKQLLARCQLSIHFIGSQRGPIPDGAGNRSQAELQYTLAMQQSHSSKLERIVWLPDGGKSANTHQQMFIESASRDSDADLITGSLEMLKDAVLNALHQLSKAPETGESSGAES